MRAGLLSLFLLVAMPVAADEPQQVAGVDTHVLSSHALMNQLERFMHEREVEVGSLTADEAVGLMVDWVRFSPMVAANGEPSQDALLYQYAGWSEGCATAFKMSLLRRVTQRDAGGDTGEYLAGITLMFEPSSQAELKPYRALSSEAKSLEDFMSTIERSPAFVELGRQKPMAAMVEGGGIR
jgi:hypothetical protein